MRRISILVATLAFTSLDACEWGPTAPEVDPVTIHVEGRVTAADDGSAVAGARVSLRLDWQTPGVITGHAQATSDALGRYALSFSFTNEEYCLRAWRRLTASAEGFLWARGESDVTCEESQTINIQLERDISHLDQAGPTN